MPVKRCEGILQANAKLSNYKIRLSELLHVLVLRQMLVPQPAPPIPNVPRTISFSADIWVSCPRYYVWVISSRFMADLLRSGRLV